MKGNSVMKAKPVSFNTFFTNMKLEQAFQKAKESEGGIIGQTRKASAKEGELSYHKTLAIWNASHEMISGRISFSETKLHHELGGTISQQQKQMN